MTGRKGRIVRHSPTDTPQYEGRTPDSDAYGAIDSLNVYEVWVKHQLSSHIRPDEQTV